MNLIRSYAYLSIQPISVRPARRYLHAALDPLSSHILFLIPNQRKSKMLAMHLKQVPR